MIKKIYLLVILFCVDYQTFANKTINYGRIYNVEDYIDNSENDLIGINRCISTVCHTIFQETSNKPDLVNSELIFTIIFPSRIYEINDKMGPVSIKNDKKEMIFERNMKNNKYNIKVKLNIIGLTVNKNELNANLKKLFKKAVNTNVYNEYSKKENTQEYWIAKNYINNGIDISKNISINKFINDHLASNNIKCNNDPSSLNFLTFNMTKKPVIVSKNKLAHNFFYFKTLGLGATEAWIYPPLSTKIMHETSIEIRGLKLTGMSSETNSHIYNINSTQHNKSFSMGFCIYIEAFKNINVSNMVLENVYGNGVFINNRFYAYINGSCNVDSNIILNVWALKYKKNCTSNSYDDSGYAISFSGIENGKSNYNYIYNDLAITKQYGSIAQASCCENNRNCETAYNFLCGYDRSIHVENGLSGFRIHHNRITGSETGIVFDGNRDYKNSNCPQANPSLIENNYISNEGIIYNENLQKLYPQHLFFSPGAHRSNEYNGTMIKNNMFVIDKNNVHTYSKNNKSECNDKDPRGYAFSDNTDRFHIKSGIRKQNINNNTFTVINSGVFKPFMVGGTYLNSFCPDEIVDPNPCPVLIGDFDCGSKENKFDNKNLFRNTLPLSLFNNTYINCEILYIMHSYSSLQNIYNNKFNVKPISISPLDYNNYIKKVK